MSESSPPASSRRTDRRVSRRVGQKEPSTVRQELRLTPEEKEQWRELAEARVKDVSSLVRELMAREYALQFPDRKRPSKRPRKG